MKVDMSLKKKKKTITHIQTLLLALLTTAMGAAHAG